MAIKTKNAEEIHNCVICNKLIYRNAIIIGKYFIHTQCSNIYRIKQEFELEVFIRKREYKANINEYIIDFIRIKQYVNIKDIYHAYNKIHNVPEFKKVIFKNSKKILLENGYEKRSPARSCTAYMRID
jgi:hypothetical protein